MAGYPKSVLNYAIKRYGRLWLDCAVHELFCLLYQNCQWKHEMRLKIVKTAHIHSTIFSCTMRAWVSRQCGFDGTFPNLRLVQCSWVAGWLQCTMLQIQTMALLLALYYCASRVIDDVMNNSTVESTSFPFVQILPLDSPLDWVQFGVFRYDDREVGVTENLRSS